MSLSDERAKKIRAMVCRIPSGCVASYGQIADLCGLGRQARLVGKVMSQLEPNSKVPWHRVIAASGKISVDPASDSFARQIQRLREEGVWVENGRIRLARFRWEPDLDELLWAPVSGSGSRSDV